MTAQRAEPVVLVVDDEASIREIARRILEAEGYHVREASNGAEAVKMLADRTPIDLLMADLEMPELEGEEMARQFRAARPDVKVLYVSGVIDRLLDERSVLSEGEAFLNKPFTAEILREAVALLLYGTVQKKR